MKDPQVIPTAGGDIIVLLDDHAGRHDHEKAPQHPSHGHVDYDLKGEDPDRYALEKKNIQEQFDAEMEVYREEMGVYRAKYDHIDSDWRLLHTLRETSVYLGASKAGFQRGTVSLCTNNDCSHGNRRRVKDAPEYPRAPDCNSRHALWRHQEMADHEGNMQQLRVSVHQHEYDTASTESQKAYDEARKTERVEQEVYEAKLNAYNAFMKEPATVPCHSACAVDTDSGRCVKVRKPTAEISQLWADKVFSTKIVL
jgi:hypothetical protein